MPWLFSKVDNFMAEDEMVNQNSHEVIETGLHKMQTKHRLQLVHLQKERLEGEAKGKEHKIRELLRKQDRRLARQVRVKEQIKTVMKNEIVKFVVDKSEVRTPAYNSELLELHANFDQTKLSLTAIGGHF